MTLARNPVIRGFAPDPSLVRVGDWYYVATSSFEWFPTIPLHRSRDLVHWEYAGHVRGAVPGDSLAGVPDSGGIWAPSLSWDGERFWVVYSVVRSVGTPYFDTDTYVSTATEIDGTWSAPRRIASHGFDPALFHEDGRLWLLNLQNDHRPGGRRFAGIVLRELDRRTLAPVGDTHLLLQHERLVEGPKVVRRDGWYYLVLAEGGTGFEHGVLVARSRALTGPYELDDRPLLTSRDDPALPLQKAGHAELVRTPDGDWVLSHLVARPLATPDGPRCPLGRETAVQALVWDAEGWPRMRHGGVHPAVEVDVPTRRQELEPREPADPLGWPWSTLRGYPDPSWADATTRPGWIRLTGRHGPESWWAHSLLARRITEHRAEAEVTVEADPGTFTQAAGLVLRYNTEAYLSLDLTWAEPEGEGQRGQQWRGGTGRRVLALVEREEFGTRQAAVVDVDTAGPLTLGVTVEDGEARFWYVRGGVRTPVGPPLDFTRLSDDYGSKLRFTGAMAGIHAMDLVDAAFTADFTGFRLTCW
ncbi:beta-xylosidase [Streptomyces lincolnensis]|uniref:Beta-xylosidase n=1 Tax=Streptomyces lincolnensis TaxID=1915 RepID=A0A1B1MJN9_STRLN|nr:family 43 glycosylhydrolase [Streptomyces lincolnensis]ANS68845.1 beta-xylosidase [Streptomyces lincolnensis]AXG52949.1 beta-xylosidase [Streptomyces lincolnensis]QMV10447.1 family 43 glycosylhydrolase [Streptomyces lincolnensis]